MANKQEKMKLKTIIETKWFHIAIILLGSIFILLGAFHTEVWFDESYTISLIRHNYSEIISIDSSDVHPVLYYLLLKTFTIFFGNSILVCRLFSVLAGIFMGFLGYTHIRKDFGPKVGLAFSFLTLFLPFMAMYGMEIRMYSWTMLFVTLTGIYAYRAIKNTKVKNWILFSIFSLCSAHCHYYGLVSVAIINLLLLLYILFSKKLYNENNISKKKYLIYFIITAVIQFLGYLPWIFIFLQQARAVSQSYWIPFNIGDSVIAPLAVQFNGRLGIISTAILTISMYIYLFYQIIRSKRDGKNVTILWYCLLVHFILYFSMLMVSIFIKPIIYYRYMLITSGIIIFPFAYCLGNFNDKKHQKIISSIIVMIVLVLSIYNNKIVIEESYDNTNGEEIQYIKEQYNEKAIILYQDFFHATNIQVQMPEYSWYLYNISSNHDLKPFENFSPPLKIIFKEDFLDNYHGRIILIDHDELQFYNMLKEKYKFTEIARKRIRINYRGFTYQIITVEK